MRTIDRARLREYIGRLNSATMRHVDYAIAVSFGLDGFLEQNSISEKEQEK